MACRPLVGRSYSRHTARSSSPKLPLRGSGCLRTQDSSPRHAEARATLVTRASRYELAMHQHLVVSKTFSCGHGGVLPVWCVVRVIGGVLEVLPRTQGIFKS